MIIRDTVPEDFDRIELQPYQIGLTAQMAEGEKHDLCMEFTKTVEADDKIIAIGGFEQQPHGHRVTAWALLSIHVAPYMVGITRAVRRVIHGVGCPRVEATIWTEFHAARRWVMMIGMEYEATLRKYLPEGRDAEMWVVINDGP